MKYNKKTNKLLKTMKWAVIAGFACDAALFAGGYYCYHQLRNSQDFRYKVYNYDPRYIDIYYRANEKYGDGKAREQDYLRWGIKKVDSFNFIYLFDLQMHALKQIKTVEEIFKFDQNVYEALKP